MSETDTKAAAAAEPAEPPRAEAPGDRPSFFLANDLLVVVGALVLLAAAYAAHGAMTRPRMATFDAQGLALRYPKGWFPSGDPGAFPTIVSFQSTEDPLIGLEAKITRKPLMEGPIGPALDLSRGTRYGEMYKRMTSCPTESCPPQTRTANGRQWLRTEFIYAFKPSDDDAPVVEHAVEYALVNSDRLYVVTLHGPEARLGELESRILSTLAVK